MKSLSHREVEAKFRIPSVHVFERMRSLDQIADFSRTAVTDLVLSDTYFDTLAFDLYRSCAAFRLRHRQEGVLSSWHVAVKHHGLQSGAIMNIEEDETIIPPSAYSGVIAMTLEVPAVQFARAL